MIKREVKVILPESYDLKGAIWFEAIKKDYDGYCFRVLLTSYLVTIILPVSSFIYELYSGRTSLLLNYLIPSIVMTVMLLYLLIFKNIRVMRTIAILTAFTGFFFSILLPGSHGAYIIIFFNFVPLIFSLTGLKGGVRWFVLFILSISLLGAFVYWGNAVSIKIYPDISMAPISFVSVFFMFAIVYSAQCQYEKIIKGLVRSIAFDSSTSLPNKDSFIRCMNGMNDSIIAILHITNFKNLATLFGYEFSDTILLSISGALQEMAKAYGFKVYKLAWHEFGLQIPLKKEFSPMMIEAELNMILHQIRQKKICMDNIEVNIALSIGGAVVQNGCYENALSRADNALCTGLALRRNITMHNTGMDVKIETLDMMNRYTVLHDNIVNSSLKSFIQPVVLSGTGEISWYESLLRIRAVEGNYESAGNYIKIAKDTGLYPALTDFMLEHAPVLIKETGKPVSVNICQLDIINPAVLQRVEQIANSQFYKKGSLILEIIESEELCNIEECLDFVRRVQSIGVRVAMDDFGAGYSNITNLLRLSLDIVKIDGELIKRMEFDDEAYELIKGISGFCKNAGYSVVAEYVENETLLLKVKEIGVDLCQGYLFGMPTDYSIVTRPDNKIPAETVTLPEMITGY